MITSGTIEGYPIKIHTREKVLNNNEVHKLIENSLIKDKFKNEYLGIWVLDENQSLIKDVPLGHLTI